MTVSETRKPHRTPEQQVADLQAKIASIEARAERKRARANPTVKQAIVAVRALDKGVAVATVKARASWSTLSSAKLVHLRPAGKVAGSSRHGCAEVPGRVVVVRLEKAGPQFGQAGPPSTSWTPGSTAG